MIPSIISFILPIVFLILFLHVSGLYPIVSDFLVLYQEFDQEQSEKLNNMELNEEYTKELIDYSAQSSQYKKDYIEYLSEHGYDWGTFLSLFTPWVIFWIISFFLILTTVSFYLTCMSYTIIALILTKKSLNRLSIWTQSNHFFLQQIILSTLKFLVLFVPFCVGLVVGIALLFLNKIVGIIVLLILAIGTIVYFIYMLLRLLFSTPILFLERQKPSDCLKMSYLLTKGRMLDAFIVGAILYGLIMITQNFGYPFLETFVGVLTHISVLKLLLSFILGLLFLVVASLSEAFGRIFFLHAYRGFKK